jgi:hypothetical protein
MNDIKELNIKNKENEFTNMLNCIDNLIFNYINFKRLHIIKYNDDNSFIYYIETLDFQYLDILELLASNNLIFKLKNTQNNNLIIRKNK